MTGWLKNIRQERSLTRGEHAVHELPLADASILVSVYSSEDVQNPRFHLADPLHVSLPPHRKVKMCKFLQLEERREWRAEGMSNSQAQMHGECKEAFSFIIPTENVTIVLDLDNKILYGVSLSFLLLSLGATVYALPTNAFTPRIRMSE